MVAFLQVSATGLAQQVSISVKNASIKQVFQRLTERTGYTFITDAELIKSIRPLNLKMDNVALDEVLHKCFEGQRVEILFNDEYKTVTIRRGSKAAVPAAVPISGKVMDEKGEPLIGASIMVKGTSSKAALTNSKGEFTITVANENSILVVSYIGYVTQEISVKGRSNVSVILKVNSQVLDNVIVTALGIKREEKALGYAVSTIKGEDLTEALSNNWTDALSGKVAGLNLVRSNGGPTGSIKIILRGENNLTGDNEALVVVDGVVINQGSGRRTAISGESINGTDGANMPADYGSGLDDINPEDIESVSVLKGPGASALYGQRGANGAIIITTKSGNPKRKGLGITFSSNSSMEEVNRWPDFQYEYGQGLGGASYYSYKASEDGANTSSTSSAYGPRFEGQLFYQYDPVTRAQGTERTPWVPYTNQIRDYFNTGQTFTNSVSIDGGTDKTTARFSVTNANNKWIIPNTGYKRNSVALAVNSKVSDKLTITSKINYTNKWSDNLPSVGYGNQGIMYWTLAWLPSADINWLKNYWEYGQEGVAIQYPFSTQPQNPYAIAYEYLNSSNRYGLTGNVQATYNFTKELSLQLRTSIDFVEEQRAQKRPYDAGTYYQKGSYRTQSIFSMEQSSDFLLKYAKKISREFDLSISAGGSMLRNNYNKDEVRADSLIYPGVYTMANAAGPLDTRPYRSKYAINSFYGLASLEYRRYLYLDLTARQDWNSVLATANRTANSGFFYPSASLSFVASERFRLPDYISFAKFRASASVVGSGGTSPYLTAFNYVSPGSVYSGALQNPSLLANPDLKPLKTTTYEVGADIRLLKSRIGVDVALYSGNTKDQILQRVADRSSGYAKLLINAGKITNRGIEIALSSKPVITKNFSWASNMTFSANKNRVADLPDSSVVLQTGIAGGGQIVAMVGGSMDALYGRGFVRSPDGQIVYNATTGNALISSDVQYLGNTIPRWKAGWNNQFRYKQFRLNVLFDAQFGGVAHSMSYAVLSRAGKTTNTLPGRYNGIVGNGVIDNGDGTYRKNDVIAYDVDAFYQSMYGVDNAEGSTYSTDFVKFREASLNYTFSAKLVKKLRLQKATIGIYGRDLYIWSKWPMYDPEFGTLSGTDITQGFEIGQFPSTRNFGVNLVIGI
ncbi:SusC/RagA family TonB-linked outer membrane protein [Pedobacter sp. BS3]|nr:SusC/RagA family TonB-linked outer membrane protein [Pedobacter sp. BS3]